MGYANFPFMFFFLIKNGWMLLTIMTPVIPVRYVPDPIIRKEPGVGPKYKKNLSSAC